MTAVAEEAATLVARGLSRHAPPQRGLFLREVLVHAAAGLAVLEGDEAAAEAIYRAADAAAIGPNSTRKAAGKLDGLLKSPPRSKPLRP